MRLCKECRLKSVRHKGKGKYGNLCWKCHEKRYFPDRKRIGKCSVYAKFKKDKCEFCNFIPMNKCQLDVDHVDGDHTNNNPMNLQTLCANCHRLKTYLNKDGIFRAS